MDIKELDIDELKRLANEGESDSSDSNKEKLMRVHPTVRRFIFDKNLKSSDKEKVPNHLIYYYYCEVWNPYGEKVSRKKFFTDIGAYFESKRHGNQRFYCIDTEPFSTDIETLIKADEHKVKINNRYKRNKK